MLVDVRMFVTKLHHIVVLMFVINWHH